MKRTEEQWQRLYRERTHRLRRLIVATAPPVIIETSARMVLEACARKSESRTILRWARHLLSSWLNMKRFALELFWFRKVRGWDEKRIKEHLFGVEEYDDDPTAKELQRMYELK